MNKIPFIIPEYDLGVRLSRILIIISKLGFNKNAKPILSSEKIAIFDFLVKNPFILNEVLKAEGKGKKITLYDTDTGSIESQFPNIASLFDYGVVRGYIRLLLSLGLVEVRTDETVYYVITDKGNELLADIETSYLLRIKELSSALVPLRSLSAAQLIKKIKPFVKGV
ncbi:ABC-three component system middle component 4 [Aeribacillus alveayuensis]|uniref:ABC-three component system middle component 4 n=1 Tax=Aeribacillus alveayuensis TaxID=279215 RepID=UPI0005D13385|nr:ABC-three component system middle component 4 [Bacillus alveayuensis]